jgi:hypothetical protein
MANIIRQLADVRYNSIHPQYLDKLAKDLRTSANGASNDPQLQKQLLDAASLLPQLAHHLDKATSHPQIPEVRPVWMPSAAQVRLRKSNANVTPEDFIPELRQLTLRIGQTLSEASQIQRHNRNIDAAASIYQVLSKTTANLQATHEASQRPVSSPRVVTAPAEQIQASVPASSVTPSVTPPREKRDVTPPRSTSPNSPRATAVNSSGGQYTADMKAAAIKHGRTTITSTTRRRRGELASALTTNSSGTKPVLRHQTPPPLAKATPTNTPRVAVREIRRGPAPYTGGMKAEALKKRGPDGGGNGPGGMTSAQKRRAKQNLAGIA